MRFTFAISFAWLAAALGSRPTFPPNIPAILPPGKPHPPPAYMVDNVNNQYGVAPDHGVLTGPVIAPLNATILHKIHNSTFARRSSQHINEQSREQPTTPTKRASDFWMADIKHGNMPLAPSNYTFFRNVMDYGATGDGTTDDTAAINWAVSSGNRCGASCGSTTVLGALVYFPQGTYLISTPVIQYYYTQFVGDPNNRPVIKGNSNFSGIALFDSDFYIPGGNGNEWYINQSNFYRQIRNFVFDMTGMSSTNQQSGQMYVPTGIHWQVGQATSIFNCDFQMSVSDSSGPATGVGIFMENGSGGFVSNLVFYGGNIGFRAGSQQFTANDLSFTNCLTAISMVWDWGFTWKNIAVINCYIAIDCTSYGGPSGQGTGSISVIDSSFYHVPYAITVSSSGPVPNIVLDNLQVAMSASIVLVSGGATILPGSQSATTVISWAMGLTYLNIDGAGAYRTGYLNPAPNKPAVLLDSFGNYFSQPKPQYEDTPASSFVVATLNGVSNLMTGDQTSAINSLLAKNVGSIIFFPAGIYLVQGTVFVPVGSRILGEAWSQIMATGSYFQSQSSPKVMVRVGNPGDQGVIEISDMLFTVQGPTAGCILMEWNVHENTQGSAAMWDSHFRVGGAAGTNLQLANCPTGATTVNPKCEAASLLFHVTSQASGYFENVWAWVADHDLDNPKNALASEGPSGVPGNVETQISIYSGRGILIESQGPSWFWGTASEHSQLYQYQLLNATNAFLGHMQTETPYYQPNPVALKPYTLGTFPDDPLFTDCSEPFCEMAWAFRVISSSNVFVYSAGFYSFFQNNKLGCTSQENCQERMVETNYASGFWLYNLFTKGNAQVISPMGGIMPIFFNDLNQQDYTSEIAVWLPLALQGANIGSPENNTKGGSGPVYIGPTIWTEPQASRTANCYPPCTLVLPPFTLSTTTTITFPPYSTSLEVGWTTTTTTTISGTKRTTIFYTSITETTVLSIPPVKTTRIPVWNVNITSGVQSTIIHATSSILPPPFTITDNPNPLKQSGVKHSPVTRTITPPPFPYVQIKPDPAFPSITFKPGPPFPPCIIGCGSHCLIFCNHPCLLNCPIPPGTNGGGFFDPNDPNYPPAAPPDGECTESTFSSCRTLCTASPTSTCTSTCSDVVGCDTTGTDIASTITPAPVVAESFEQWPATSQSVQVIFSGAQAVLNRLSGYGDYKSTASPTGTCETVFYPSTCPNAFPSACDSAGSITECCKNCEGKRKGLLAKIDYSTITAAPKMKY